MDAAIGPYKAIGPDLSPYRKLEKSTSPVIVQVTARITIRYPNHANIVLED